MHVESCCVCVSGKEHYPNWTCQSHTKSNCFLHIWLCHTWYTYQSIYAWYVLTSLINPDKYIKYFLLGGRLKKTLKTQGWQTVFLICYLLPSFVWVGLYSCNRGLTACDFDLLNTRTWSIYLASVRWTECLDIQAACISTNTQITSLRPSMSDDSICTHLPSWGK